MRILALDYGQKRIGVAFSEGIQAEGMTHFSHGEAFTRIPELCRTLRVEQIVIGLPEGRMGKLSREFGVNLEKICRIPVVYWDETLSTKTAQEYLRDTTISRKRQQQKEHQIAAALILQSYIDAKN